MNKLAVEEAVEALVRAAPISEYPVGIRGVVTALVAVGIPEREAREAVQRAVENSRVLLTPSLDLAPPSIAARHYPSKEAT